jgi:hypothetical protein
MTTSKPPIPAGVAPSPRIKSRQRTGGTAPMGRSAILASLSALADGEPSPDHFEAYQEEATAISNDRGAAILIATNLENALELAITRQMMLGRKPKNLFGFNSPFGPFLFKIRVGHALRIFGDETFNNLDMIRAIRNTFAHAKKPIRFADGAVNKACALLTIPAILAPLPDTTEPSADQRDGLQGRERFQLVCHSTAHNLRVRSMRGPLPIEYTALKVHMSEGYEIWAFQNPLP